MSQDLKKRCGGVKMGLGSLYSNARVPRGGGGDPHGSDKS